MRKGLFVQTIGIGFGSWFFTFFTPKGETKHSPAQPSTMGKKTNNFSTQD